MTSTAAKGPSGAPPDGEDRRAVYEQDAEFVRHHDGLKWSRFQLVSVIEGAALYALLETGPGQWQGLALMAAATIIIGFIFLLAIVDSRVTRCHLQRMGEFERACGARFPEADFRPLFRKRTTRVAMAAVLIFNLVVMAAQLCISS